MTKSSIEVYDAAATYFAMSSQLLGSFFANFLLCLLGKSFNLGKEWPKCLGLKVQSKYKIC